MPFLQRCREIGKVARIGSQRVLGAPALGGNHIEEQLDHEPVGVIALEGHGDQGCFANLSGGTQTVISRGFGSNQVASMNMAP